MIHKIRSGSLRERLSSDFSKTLIIFQKLTEKACKHAWPPWNLYFKPKTNVVYERYRFNSSTQVSNEAADSFMDRLRKLASTCNFGALTDELISDRLSLVRQGHTCESKPLLRGVR